MKIVKRFRNTPFTEEICELFESVLHVYDKLRGTESSAFVLNVEKHMTENLHKLSTQKMRRLLPKMVSRLVNRTKQNV
jgi:hypothetical protein